MLNSVYKVGNFNVENYIPPNTLFDGNFVLGWLIRAVG